MCIRDSNNAERGVLEDRVAEVGQAPVPLLIRFGLGCVGGGDGHPIAKLDCALTQPPLFAILPRLGELLAQGLACQCDLAIPVKQTASAIEREQHAHVLAQ